MKLVFYSSTNWKGFGRKELLPNRGIPAFDLNELTKTKRISASLANHPNFDPGIS